MDKARFAAVAHLYILLFGIDIFIIIEYTV